MSSEVVVEILSTGDGKLSRNDSTNDPNDFKRGMEDAKEYGVFGEHAVIWKLSRTREIGLVDGKPREDIRLLVLKNEVDENQPDFLLKRMCYSDWKSRKKCLMEIEALRHVSAYGPCRNISRFYGGRECITAKLNGKAHEGKFDYLMDYGDGGDVLSWVQMKWETFSTLEDPQKQEDFLKTHISSVQLIIAQVAAAVKHCFEAKIVHFDIKLENVVMTGIGMGDTKCCVKLIDFGLAQHFAHGDWSYRGGPKGTWRYMAPEIFAGDSLTDARIADLWPIGVMIWESLTGIPLWEQPVESSNTYSAILKKGGFKFWFAAVSKKPANRNISKFVPEDAVELLNQIFNSDPNKRLTIEHTIDDKFLKSQNPIDFTATQNSSSVRMVESKDDDMIKVGRVLSGTIELGLKLTEGVSQRLTRYSAVEQRGKCLRCKAICAAVRFWFRTWFLYSLFIVAWLTAAPFWLSVSGFWEFHSYWSIFAAGLPLILGLFLYHSCRGSKKSRKLKRSDKNINNSTALNIVIKPLVTEFSQLSSLAVAVMWITNNSWTNVDLDDPANARYKTEMNGYVILICLIVYRVLSSVFFYLRAREMGRRDLNQSKLRIVLSQLFGLRIYWDVETACSFRRQTTAIREHKILEGILNAFIFLILGTYYYFEKSMFTEDDKEATWLIFALSLALVSVALVLNMGDILAIGINQTMWWREIILIVFRMFEVAFRVAAYAVFATCVSARYTFFICLADVLVMYILYRYCHSLQINTFEFDNSPDRKTNFVKTFLSSIYGIIACPYLHLGKYWYPVKVVHDAALIIASWWFRSDNVVLWDKRQTFLSLYGAGVIFFVLGVLVYHIINWKQYFMIIKFEKDADFVKNIIKTCKNQPELLNRFLVSGVLRVSTVKAEAIRGWEEYGEIWSWLWNEGFYDLIDEDRRDTTSEAEPSKDQKNFKEYDKFQVSYTTKAKVLCMSVSQGGDFLAVGLGDKPYLQILKLPSMKEVKNLSDSPFLGAVTGVEFGKWVNNTIQLITVSEDAKLRIFMVPGVRSEQEHEKKDWALKPEFEQGIKVKEENIVPGLKKSTHKIRCLAVNCSKYNFIVGAGKEIWFYEPVDNSHRIESFVAHTDEVTALKFFPNPTKFASVSKDKTVRIWQRGKSDKVNFDLLWNETVDGIIKTLDVNKKGNAWACGCTNGSVFVWEKKIQGWMDEAKESPPTPTPPLRSQVNVGNWVSSVNFLNDNSLMIHTRPSTNRDDKKGLNNGYSAIWNFKSNESEPKRFLQPKIMAVESSCVFGYDGELKLLTGSWNDQDEHKIIIWDTGVKDEECKSSHDQYGSEVKVVT